MFKAPGPSNSEMSKLFAAAKIKDVAVVQSILNSGVLPDCKGIHTTCDKIAPEVTKTASKIGAGVGVLESLLKELQEKIDINKQQDDVIKFLTVANSEAAQHGFIKAMQKDLAEAAMEGYKKAMDTQNAELDVLQAKLEKSLEDLKLQKQKASIDRAAQEQLREQERKALLLQKEQAIEEERRIAKAREVAEKEKIAAREILDKALPGGKGHRLLHKAVIDGKPDEICKLIDQGATVDIPDAHKQTPLWLAACQYPNLKCVQALEKGGAKATPELIKNLEALEKNHRNYNPQIQIIRSHLSKR